MKILKIWDADYPWDVRVEKVASSLTAAGHDVHLVARNRQARQLVERLPEATVHRLAPLRWAGARLSAASMFPAFCNPRWARAILRTGREIGADLVLVRDLPLAPTAIWAARRLGVPVVMDMAENYPAMMRALWENGLQKPIDWVVRNPAFVERVERWVLPRLDHTFTVVDESRDRLLALGVAADRVSVVGNTPVLARLDQLPPKEHRDGAGLDLIYLGLLEGPRGLGVMIDAIALAHRRGVKARLTVLGHGRERASFEAQARERGLGDAVEFLGHVPYAEAVRRLLGADVGVVPHFANESWNTTIPNKLFDYMAAGIPVLTSDARPAARIVRETASGEVYPYRNAEAAAEAITRLAHAETRQRQGRAGRQAVVERYNWTRESERLLAGLDRAVAGAA